MSGTDVAKEPPAAEAQEKSKAAPNTLLTVLKIWLPFPLMLGAILFFQIKQAGIKPDPAKVAEAKAAFQGAGPELPNLMQALQEERDAVKLQRDELEFAQRRILLEQSEISTRQHEVEELLARVESKLGSMEDEKSQMISQLARVYETMKSGAAADILEALDVETATEILRRMKEKKAAEIMGNLKPEAASKISEAMLKTGKKGSK